MSNNLGSYMHEIKEAAGLNKLLMLDEGQATENGEVAIKSELAKQLNAYMKSKHPEGRSPNLTANSKNLDKKAKRMIGNQYFEHVFGQLDSYIDNMWEIVGQFTDELGATAYTSAIVSPFEELARQFGINVSLDIAESDAYRMHNEEIGKLRAGAELDKEQSKKVVTAYLADLAIDEESKKELEEELLEDKVFIAGEHQVGLNQIINNNADEFKSYVKRISEGLTDSAGTGMEKYERVKGFVKAYENIDDNVKKTAQMYQQVQQRRGAAAA